MVHLAAALGYLRTCLASLYSGLSFAYRSLARARLLATCSGVMLARRALSRSLLVSARYVALPRVLARDIRDGFCCSIRVGRAEK